MEVFFIILFYFGVPSIFVGYIASLLTRRRWVGWIVAICVFWLLSGISPLDMW